MALTRTDQAKYPFLLNAAEEVRSLGLRIESLESPELKPILDRAEGRIEEALQNNPPEVSYHPREEGIEIPSFPVAVMLAAASASDYLKRRYALAEAIRAYGLLREEDKKKVVEIARVFGWKIRMPHRKVGDRSHDFALHFTDFLTNTRSFREKEWKLVNKTMLNGEVYLSRREVARLLQEEIRQHVEGKLSIDIRSQLPDSILKRLENLKTKYGTQIGRSDFPEFRGEVVNEAFPPCIRYLYDAAKSGRRLSHVGRFTLTSFLIRIGMKTDDVVDLFRSFSDFNERMTRYQVEHIAGDRGSRTKYVPPTCDTLRTHGLCPAEADVCRRVKHPLTYYRLRTGTLKKQVPAS